MIKINTFPHASLVLLSPSHLVGKLSLICELQPEGYQKEALQEPVGSEFKLTKSMEIIVI